MCDSLNFHQKKINIKIINTSNAPTKVLCTYISEWLHALHAGLFQIFYLKSSSLYEFKN